MAKTKSKSTQKKQVDKDQLTMMTLNFAHLIFLHGLVKNLFNQIDTTKSKDNSKMYSFLHDLLIMFEIYIDSVEKDDEIIEKFNYTPIEHETQKNDKK